MNINFLQLSRRYLFSSIEDKVLALRKSNPDASILSLGVGDIALPLAPTVVEALKKTAEEMGEMPHGYGPSEGQLFLREKILATEYPSLGFSNKEIFISEGIARELSDIQDIFCHGSTVGIIDPTYPAYFDTTILAGKKIHLIPCLEENGFIPKPPNYPIDLVYLCSPNNPTGTAMSRKDLKAWVDWALTHKSVLLFDAAYQKFISSPDVPKTIYEIPGAKQVAIEFRSFSKSAGFSGLRLGYTMLPKELRLDSHELPALWKIRQDIRMNGISYPIQKAGFATLFGDGKEEVDAQVELYKSHAKQLRACIESLGHTCFGGEDSPYVWWKVGGDSWKFFDKLLNDLHLVTVPGRGFGASGEGFIRLSAFITPETLEKALSRLGNICVTK